MCKNLTIPNKVLQAYIKSQSSKQRRTLTSPLKCDLIPSSYEMAERIINSATLTKSLTFINFEGRNL